MSIFSLFFLRDWFNKEITLEEIVATYEGPVKLLSGLGLNKNMVNAASKEPTYESTWCHLKDFLFLKRLKYIYLFGCGCICFTNDSHKQTHM